MHTKVSCVDAIMSAANFLKAVEMYAETLPRDDVLGQATMHCGTIRGGEENSSYAGSCTLTLEFRTVNDDSTSQSSAAIVKDITNILDKLAAADKKFKFELPKVLFERKPLLPMAKTHPLLVATAKAIADVRGEKEVRPTAAKFWTDAALLSEAGIPSLVFGPTGEGLHGKDEWVDVESIMVVEQVMREVIERFQ
ncbi:putative metallopeptidase, partial [Aureobasidium melanogenum]